MMRDRVADWRRGHPMNEVHTLAGWKALAVLALMLATLAVGGRALAQAPADEARAVYPSAGGLDHFSANEQTILPGASVTLAVGYRHQVCLVSDSSVRPASVVQSADAAEGPAWVIATEEGKPVVEGTALVHPNAATATTFGRETCVYWTSSEPGVQTVLLQNGARVLADDGLYTEVTAGLAAPMPLRVRWVAAPAISLTSGGQAVTAPIAQRLRFYGTDARGDHYHTPDTVTATVGVTAGALETDNLAGLPVSFAVTGGCGTVTVPGAIGVGVARGVIESGETASVQWGAAPVEVAIANPFCATPEASTTLAVTAGEASATVRVDWAWDGYAGVTVEDAGTDGTEKRVTFHTAAPVYRGNTVRGWVCDSDLQSRAVSFSVSGGSVFVAGGAQQTLPTLASYTGRRIAANADAPAALASRFAATDSECRQSWTVRSTARSSDIDLVITSAGFAFSRTLDFTERELQTRTLERLDQDLVEGGATIIAWTFKDTPVENVVVDLDVTAIYYWDAAAQAWRSWFPGAEGLGVNTLTQMEMDAIYAVYLD